jgi:hypothetical protein
MLESTRTVSSVHMSRTGVAEGADFSGYLVTILTFLLVKDIVV